MRVAIGVLSARDWKPQFGISLTHLFAHIAGHDKTEGVGLIPYLNCSLVPRGRRVVVEDALRDGYTHLLFVDDDMYFPPEIFDHLSKHDKPMVAVNYQTKSGKSAAVSL